MAESLSRVEQPTASQQVRDELAKVDAVKASEPWMVRELLAETDSLEARLRVAEQDRDTERGTAELLSSHLASTAEKLSAAEGRLRVAEEALRRIQFYPFAVTSDDQTDLRAIKDIAAAALGSVGVGEEG